MPALGDAPITAAVLGQGSIGRRHAGLLVERGCAVLTWDPEGGADVEGARSVATAAEALGAADLAIVASPTIHHLDQLGLALEHGCHVLVEKPASTTAAGVAEAAERATAQGLVAAVAMNLRFHPGPSTVRRLVADGAIGRPLTAQVAFGSYLPDWRPATDYRTGYSARSDLGGGVLLDAIHELDYATWVLGPVADVDARLVRVSDLELDVEDAAVLSLRHEGGTLSVITLDYLDRSYHRGCRIVGSGGSLAWSWEREAVDVLLPGNEPETLPAPSDAGPAYGAQLDAFLDACRTGRLAAPLCGLQEAGHVMALADAARAADRDGRRTAPAR